MLCPSFSPDASSSDTAISDDTRRISTVTSTPHLQSRTESSSSLNATEAIPQCHLQRTGDSTMPTLEDSDAGETHVRQSGSCAERRRLCQDDTIRRHRAPKTRSRRCAWKTGLRRRGAATAMLKTSNNIAACTSSSVIRKKNPHTHAYRSIPAQTSLSFPVPIHSPFPIASLRRTTSLSTIFGSTDPAETTTPLADTDANAGNGGVGRIADTGAADLVEERHRQHD
ncbi:hypothetical protein R3P38DRAFT_3243555 [Favolaschia claudopus]|uniref:Uncharacterized protein n=1 Tax=Favolaschia claudopus TaxID=2862362 RepID=A0AAV9Z325_9AGAR